MERKANVSKRWKGNVRTDKKDQRLEEIKELKYWNAKGKHVKDLVGKPEKVLRMCWTDENSLGKILAEVDDVGKFGKDQ